MYPAGAPLNHTFRLNSPDSPTSRSADPYSLVASTCVPAGAVPTKAGVGVRRNRRGSLLGHADLGGAFLVQPQEGEGEDLTTDIDGDVGRFTSSYDPRTTPLRYHSPCSPTTVLPLPYAEVTDTAVPGGAVPKELLVRRSGIALDPYV